MLDVLKGILMHLNWGKLVNFCILFHQTQWIKFNEILKQWSQQSFYYIVPGLCAFGIAAVFDMKRRPAAVGFVYRR